MNYDDIKEDNPTSPHKRRIHKEKNLYFRIHIGVLGEDKCGKTSLIQTFLTKTFLNDIKENTILQTNKVTIKIENKPIELCCAIGDDYIDGKPYSEIVSIARDYINKIGGFEKFAEWGLIR